MSNGASKYIESLNPLAYYTFDDADTVVNDNKYYFINKTPYDFPFLRVNTTSIDGYTTINNHNPTSYSLSNVEVSRSYKSYSTGYLKDYDFNQITYRSDYTGDFVVYHRIETPKKFSPITTPTIDEIPDYVYNDIGNEYTIMMQIKAFDMMTMQSFGTLCREDFTKDPLFPDAPVLDINGNVIDITKPRYIELPSPIDIDHQRKSISFWLLDIVFRIEYLRENYCILRLMSSTGIIVNSLVMSTDESTNVAFVVTEKNISIRTETTETSIVSARTRYPEVDRKKIQFGFITAHSEKSYSNTSQPESIRYRDSGKLTPLYCNRYNVLFDNISLVNRALSVAEVRRYHALNTDIKRMYKNNGFVELYDFNQHYDNYSTDHLQSGYPIVDVISGVRSSLRPSSDDPYNGFVVNRYESGNIQYSLKFSKRSMLYDMPYYNYSNTYRLIKQESFSLSFFFKTSDNDGLLYAYSKNVSDTRNIMFIFKGGVLQFWRGAEILLELNGYSNNEFHHIVITNSESSMRVYMNKALIYTGYGAYDSSSLKCSVFGNGLPHVKGLEFELALLAYGNRPISALGIFDINSNNIMYEASGIITLNNIRVGTTVLIYDHYSGELLERTRSSAADGIFRYSNRYPFTITVVVNDDDMLSGRSYIVSPVELK